MNQLTTFDADAADVDPHRGIESAERPGRQLRMQRQSRGIEIERIATQLHLRGEVVEALEQDRYEALPAPVYVIGYLRNYARLVGLDPNPIIAAYHAAIPDADAWMTPAIPAQKRQRNIRSAPLPVRPILLVSAGAILAAGLFGFWWQYRAGITADSSAEDVSTAFGSARSTAENAERNLAGTAASNEPDALEQTLQAVPDDRPLDAAAVSSPATSTISSPNPQSPALSSGTSPSASERLTPPPAAVALPVSETDESSAAAAGVVAEVALEFSGSSWVSVLGSDGKVVLNGEMREGDRRVLKGKPPFKFVIGNATATRMTVGGQPFDVMGRSRGNVARFSFDPASPQ